MKLKYYTNSYKLMRNYPTAEDINYEINLYLKKMDMFDTGFTYRIYNRIYTEEIIKLEKFKEILNNNIGVYFEKISDKKYKTIILNNK